MNSFKLKYLAQTEGTIVTNESNLSVCLTADGFVFALVGKDFTLKALGEFSVELQGSIPQVMMNMKTCFNSIGVHIFNFNKVRIICPADRNVWIPFKLYDQTKNKEYLKQTNAVYSSDTILSNVCNKIDAVNIFAFPLHQYSGMKIVMPKAEFVSTSQVLTEYAFDVSSLMQNTIVLHKNNNRVEIAVFKASQFTLANSFDYKTPQDIIYFLLYTLKQLNISTAEVNLMITGEEYTEEELLLLKRYIKNVSYANPTENINIPMEFNGIDLQKYFFLLV